MELTKIAIIIPAWQPDARLNSLVDALLQSEIGLIVILDDGSVPPVRDGIAEQTRVRVLRHGTNLGKGRALKTAMNYVLVERPGLIGVVTADADGQHLAEDVLRVAATLAGSPAHSVLGVRGFADDVPLRSRLGNAVTRYVFWFLARRRVSDTQSGLRGFPTATIPELLPLQGERYEYEMNVLAHLCRKNMPPIEIPIRTVYLEQNRSSHFNPIRDSMRIYFVLLRFYASSMAAAAIDFAVFGVVFAGTHNILISTLVGRVSSLANFALNKRYVFQARGPVRAALWRYYLLAGVMAGLSYASVRVLSFEAGWNAFAAKIVVDTVLSLASFALQKTIVFLGWQHERVPPTPAKFDAKYSKHLF